MSGQLRVLGVSGFMGLGSLGFRGLQFRVLGFGLVYISYVGC